MQTGLVFDADDRLIVDEELVLVKSFGQRLGVVVV